MNSFAITTSRRAVKRALARPYAWLNVRARIGGIEWRGTDAFGIGFLLGMLIAIWFFGAAS